MSKIYNYDANGYYTGVSYDFNGKVLPKFTTRVAPPKTNPNEKAKYVVSGNTWTIEIQEVNINVNRNEGTNPPITTSVFDLDKGGYTVPVSIGTDTEEIDKLKDDVNEKLAIMQKEMDNLKQQLSLLKTKMLIKI